MLLAPVATIALNTAQLVVGVTKKSYQSIVSPVPMSSYNMFGFPQKILQGMPKGKKERKSEEKKIISTRFRYDRCWNHQT